MMRNEIVITYDRDKCRDLPAVTCFERDYEKIYCSRVAYAGKTAEELIKIVTKPGYLDELLKGNKPDTRPLNKVIVHFIDGGVLKIYTTDIVLDDPEYLILTNDSYKKYYFNKKNIIYYEMEVDRG